jgi:membrane fusion protein, multidrug efflux system
MSSVGSVGLSLLCLGVLLAGCGQSAASVGPPPGLEPPGVAIRTAPVTEARLVRHLRGSGRLQGKQEMSLAFRNGGTVRRLVVETGATVRRGQLLATLDRTESGAQLAQAEAAFEKARRDLARAEQQRAGGAISVADFQNARTTVEQAEAGLRAARYADQVTVLRAPDDGQVQRRLVEVNEQVAPGQPVFAMRSAGRGWVTRVGLVDRDAVQVRIGDRATTRFDAFPGVVFPGTVTEIAGAAWPQTGTYQVEVSVEPGSAQLLSGLVAKVEIEPSQVPVVRAVPIEAVVEGNGLQASVYVAQADATARKVPIRIAFIEGSQVAVATGLDGVVEVVTDGASYLAPGTRVRRVE